MDKFIFDDHFKNRLSETRRNLKITQHELANRIGVGQTAITSYEQGRIRPKESILLRLAYELGVSPAWLSCGDDTAIGKWAIGIVTPTTEVRQIPIYTNEQIKNIYLNEEFYLPEVKPCPVDTASNSAFAMKIMGDEMVSSSYISFPPQSIVTFDTEFRAKSGNFYLVLLSELVTFKQLFFGDFETTFKSLNENYPSYQIKNTKFQIIAEAIYVEINLQTINMFGAFPKK